MKLHFSKKANIILIFIILLFAIGIVYTQFFYINPLKSDLKLKNQTLKSEQNLLNAIGHKKDNNTENTNANTSELQKRLPVEPLQDQFILDLEQAETVSDSQIKSMSFTNDEQAQKQVDQNNSGNGSAGQQNNSTTKGNTVQQNSSTSNGSESQASGISLPNGVKKLTVQLNVESQGYSEFEKFIDALEGLKRIVVVEAIDYSAGNELTSIGQGNKPFSYNLTVSTFYMPGLTDLKGQLPKVEVPNPAEKQNPLSQFPDVPNP
jgi:type IV pilus assembly protein PilO